VRSLSLCAIILTATLASQGCGDRNVSFFGTPTTQYVSRREVADQGSGKSASPDYRAGRVTIGGSYLRRRNASSQSFRVNAGLHGNPDAFQ
jgi:hypothetical protein